MNGIEKDTQERFGLWLRIRLRVESDNRKGRVYQKGQMQKVPRRGNVNGKWEWTGDVFGLKEHK